jgi:cell division transport system permease protein
MSGFLARHAQQAIGALGTLWRQPVATTMTIAVIGIALALPASLGVLVQSAQKIAGGWTDARDFSIYLKAGVSLEGAERLGGELRRRALVSGVTVVSADRALEQLRDDPAFAEVIRALKGNPLPHAVVVRPAKSALPAELDSLRAELEQRPEVDLVQLDTEWLNRLHAMLEFGRRSLWLASVLLIVAVVVTVGNTIRLDVQHRRQEIEVAKLLGATDAFVRRPFLYLGVWYGLMGGLLALGILAAGLYALSGPLRQLAELYGADFSGLGLSVALAGLVLLAGILAGWGGSWAAVGRHLASIEPQV